MTHLPGRLTASRLGRTGQAQSTFRRLPPTRNGNDLLNITVTPTSIRFLIKIELVAVQVPHHHAGSIGHHSRFSIELNAATLDFIKIPQAIIGLDTEKQLCRGLASNESFFLGGAGHLEIQRYFLAIRGLNEQSTVVAQMFVLRHPESEFVHLKLQSLFQIRDIYLEYC